MNIENSIKIRLSLQRALLCEVATNLRMVAVDWNKSKKIINIFYFDGSISDENKDSATSVGAEVAGDFDEDIEVIENCIQSNWPQRLPMHTCIAYSRKEQKS